MTEQNMESRWENSQDTSRKRSSFEHKSFEERLDEFNGEISICFFDWGEPAGDELL